VGSVRRLVHAGEARRAGAAHSALRTGVRPAAPFAGYGLDGACLPPAHDAGAAGDAPNALAASAPLPDDDDAAVVGVAWHDAAGEHVTTARLTVICDGMFSVLRPKLSAGVPRTVSYFCGLLLAHAPGAPPVPYPQRGHVVMADPSPVLLYQISSTETRLLADVPAAVIEGAAASAAAGDDNGDGGDDIAAARAAALRSHFERTIVPQLPAASRGAVLAALAAQEPVVMPCKQLAAAPSSRAGAVLLGDSWNMRHPLTGGGMTVALRDVEALRGALAGADLRGAAAPVSAGLQARLAAFAARRASHAATINILANALHRVMSAPASDDGRRARLRAACIEYMGLGGPFSAGPVGLLSGLTPRPTVLILHFVAVALHATARALLPLPTPARARAGYDLLHVACIILMPLLAAERIAGWSSPALLAAVDAVFPWKGKVLE
jgi:squalene monooxygenase